MNLGCSRLSDSGEDVKEKGTQKVGGAGKWKGERACNHLFYDPLPPTFGTFEISWFQPSNCRNVNELESFSNFLWDYFAWHLSHMQVRAIWSVQSGSVGNTRLFNFLQSPYLNNSKRFSFVRECDGLLQWVLSHWAQLVSVFRGCEILTDGDSQIQISKNGLQLKLKLL